MSRSVRKNAGTVRPYHHGDLRATLLATTRTLLAEGGIEALSIREVSRRAGVSNAAAYNHFAGRGDLVRAVVADAFVELAKAIRGAQRRATDPLERLRRAGAGYVSFALSHPAEFRVMFRPELFARRSEHDDACGEDDAYAALTEAIAVARAAGAIVGDEPTLVLAAWSMVHGLATLALDGPLAANLSGDDARTRALARELAAIVVRGMEPR